MWDRDVAQYTENLVTRAWVALTMVVCYPSHHVLVPGPGVWVTGISSRLEPQSEDSDLENQSSFLWMSDSVSLHASRDRELAA